MQTILINDVIELIFMGELKGNAFSLTYLESNDFIFYTNENIEELLDIIKSGKDFKKIVSSYTKTKVKFLDINNKIVLLEITH